MGRSVKKGPYVQEVLYKRVKAMNDAGEKCSRHGAELLQYSLNSLVTHSQFTTDVSTFLYM